MNITRQMDIAVYEHAAWVEEQAFLAWADETVFPEFVNRLIGQIGEAA